LRDLETRRMDAWNLVDTSGGTACAYPVPTPLRRQTYGRANAALPGMRRQAIRYGKPDTSAPG
jgi:hypothetical protein